MCFEHQLTIEHAGLMKYQRGIESTRLIQLDLLNRPPVLPVPFDEDVDLRGVYFIKIFASQLLKITFLCYFVHD